MFAQAAWPAAPSKASPWGGPLVLHRPTTVVTRRVVSRPKPPPPPRVKASPLKPAAAGLIFGVALQFGVEFCPTVKDTGKTARVVVVAGALDASLRRIARGTETARLQFDHDRDLTTCSSADRSLTFSVRGGRLWFQVRGQTRGGRLAIACARKLTDCRQMSVGLSEATYYKRPADDADGECWYVTEARLSEVSFVAAGACPRTWVCV